MLQGLSRRPVVVPFQPILDITRNAGVVPGGVALAPEDIDEALADAAHAGRSVHGARQGPTIRIPRA